MTFTKFASMSVLSVETAETANAMQRTAHRHEFKYDLEPGYIYVRSRAISSRCNDNFDEFSAPEIKKAYKTFVGKPVFVNHENSNHRRARGVIIDAALHEDQSPDGRPDTWVEVLMQVDAVNFPKLAKAILAGHIDRTSMGTDVAFSVCSACGNKATTPLEYCAHIPRMKGIRTQRTTASGKREGVLIREICHGLKFFENSLLIEEPADPTAFAWVDKVAKKTASHSNEEDDEPSRSEKLRDKLLYEKHVNAFEDPNDTPVEGNDKSYLEDRYYTENTRPQDDSPYESFYDRGTGKWEKRKKESALSPISQCKNCGSEKGSHCDCEGSVRLMQDRNDDSNRSDLPQWMRGKYDPISQCKSCGAGKGDSCSDGCNGTRLYKNVKNKFQRWVTQSSLREHVVAMTDPYGDLQVEAMPRIPPNRGFGYVRDKVDNYTGRNSEAPLGNNTSGWKDTSGNYHVKLYDTNVVSYNGDGSHVTYNHGGYETPTTARRMDEFGVPEHRPTLSGTRQSHINGNSFDDSNRASFAGGEPTDQHIEPGQNVRGGSAPSRTPPNRRLDAFPRSNYDPSPQRADIPRRPRSNPIDSISREPGANYSPANDRARLQEADHYRPSTEGYGGDQHNYDPSKTPFEEHDDMPRSDESFNDWMTRTAPKPKFDNCPTCDGKGRQQINGERQPCQTCAGNGYLDNEGKPYNPGSQRTYLLRRYIAGLNQRLAYGETMAPKDVNTLRDEACPVCFVPGTLIRTEDGYIPINEINPGDKVLSKGGVFRKVRQVFERPYDGLIYEIHARSLAEPIRVTPEHPMVALVGTHAKQNNVNRCRPGKCAKYGDLFVGGRWGNSEVRHDLEWVEAKNLVKGGYLGTSVLETTTDIKSISVPQEFRGNKVRRGSYDFDLTNDFLWAIGLYLAEGSASARHINFALHQDETEYVGRLERIFQGLGYSTALITRTTSKGVWLEVYSTTLASWFPAWLGSGSHNKSIPAKLLNMPLERLSHVVQGVLDGDDTKKTAQFGQTSIYLALQVAEYFMRRDDGATIYDAAPLNKKHVYTVNHFNSDQITPKNWKVQNTLLSEITETRTIPYAGFVYNLEVAGEPSYTVQNVLVHNCSEKDSYDGNECSVCGFVKPPDMFLDPDLDKAKQLDLRKDQNDQPGGQQLNPGVNQAIGDPNAVDAQGMPNEVPGSGMPGSDQVPIDPNAVDSQGMPTSTPGNGQVPGQDRLVPPGMVGPDGQPLIDGNTGLPEIGIPGAPQEPQGPTDIYGQPLGPTGPATPGDPQIPTDPGTNLPVDPVTGQPLDTTPIDPETQQQAPQLQQPNVAPDGQSYDLDQASDQIAELQCPVCGFTTEAAPPMSVTTDTMGAETGDVSDGAQVGDICPQCGQGLLIAAVQGDGALLNQEQGGGAPPGVGGSGASGPPQDQEDTAEKEPQDDDPYGDDDHSQDNPFGMGNDEPDKDDEDERRNR